MGSLIGLKNVIMFSAVLLTIGSVSAQQAFAGSVVFVGCQSVGNGDWSNAANWGGCDGPTPDSGDEVFIDNNDIVITGDEQAGALNIDPDSTLFIDCDASLTVSSGGGDLEGDITNHGDFTVSAGELFLFGGTLFNSGTFSGVVVDEGGSIVEISTICSQPIGGTVGSMDTVSLLVAGAQANMGLLTVALVSAVVAGVGIAYKAKTNKTHKETL